MPKVPSSQEIADRLLSNGTRPARVSASAIDRYRTCPRWFLFQDVAKLDPGSHPSEVLVVANAVHEALEQFFGIQPASRTEAVLHNCLRSVWTKHRKPGVFENRDHEIAAGQSALRLLSLFMAKFDWRIVPVAREEWASSRLPDKRKIFGKLDRVDLLDDGTLEIVDYKTGKPKVSRDELPSESAALVYLVAAEDEFGRAVSRVSFLYLAAGKKVTWEVEREDVAMAHDKLAAISAAINADGEFKAHPGHHCSWCPFKHPCPDAKRVEVEDLVVPSDLGF